MRIWQLHFDGDNYESFMPVKFPSVEEIQTFDGRPKKDSWIPLKVERMHPETGLELSDTPGLFLPVFSKRAADILLPLIKDSAELLELDFSEGQYFGIHVTNVLNVIDYTKSEYVMFSDNKRIMMFNKYAFRICNEIKNSHIFKIVDEPLRWAFVSDEFKRTVEEHDLTGFVFKLVWDSENT